MGVKKGHMGGGGTVTGVPPLNPNSTAQEKKDQAQSLSLSQNLTASLNCKKGTCLR